MPVGLGDSLWHGDGHGVFVILVHVPQDSEAAVDGDVFGPLQEVRRFVCLLQTITQMSITHTHITHLSEGPLHHS